jgi:ABC-type polysaccharide/polyol phosphate export permease
MPLPQSIFILRTLMVQSFYLLIGISSGILVLIVFSKFNFIGIIYSIPGFCILILYFYGSSGSMAYLGLRYRDLQHAVSSIFSMLFILTPVVYPPEVLIKKGIGFAVYINPFASLIEIIRYPLLNHQIPDNMHYAISLIFTLGVISIRYIIAKKWERFVPFWS